MPWLIARPATLPVGAAPPGSLDEYVGRVNSGHEALSVAILRSPRGWTGPGRRPEHLEVSVVLAGRLHVRHAAGVLEVPAGAAVVCRPGEWRRYAAPEPGGAETVTVCLPACDAPVAQRDGPATRAPDAARLRT